VDEAGDPAAAFEALRVRIEKFAADFARVMTVIRKGVEFALDQIERRVTPADNSAELGRMSQNKTATNERLQRIEQSPRSTARSIMRVSLSASEGLVQSAVQQLER